MRLGQGRAAGEGDGDVSGSEQGGVVAAVADRERGRALLVRGLQQRKFVICGLCSVPLVDLQLCRQCGNAWCRV